MSAKIGTGVVGVGIFGDTHARTFAESEIADLRWVCDINEERAKAAAAKYGCRYTTHPEEIASDSEISLVSIATPDFAHRDVSLLMIDSKKNLLIEKPLATNMADASAIVNAAKTKGIRMATDFQNRWNPPFIQAKKALESGELGYPVTGYIRLCNSVQVTEWLSWAGRSGPQWFLGPHIVDLIRWLFGQDAKSVSAYGHRKLLKNRGFDTYDAIQAQIVFENGTFATVETAWVVPPSWPGLDFRMDMLCSKGKIMVEPNKQGVAISGGRFDQPFILGRQEAYGTMYGFFREPLVAFLRALRDDKPFIVQPDDGLEVTRIIVAMEKSIESGQAIEVKSIS